MQQREMPELGRREPTEKEIKEYFTKFSLRLREKLKILQDPELRLWGEGVKKEGWFVAYHSVLEAALVLKIADLLHLDHEDKQILLDAAITHHAHKRLQYRDDAKDYSRGRELAWERMKDLVSSQDVWRVNEVADTRFVENIADGTINLQGQDRITKLQKILSFAHNSVHTTIDRTGNEPSQRSDIVSIHDLMTSARRDHPELLEKQIIYRGVQRSYLDVEEDIERDIETDIKEGIASQNPDLALSADTSLGLRLRELIMQDIKSATLPLLPQDQH